MSAEVKTFEVRPAEGVNAQSVKAQMLYWGAPEGKVDRKKDTVIFEGTDEDAANLRRRSRSIASVIEVVASVPSGTLPLQRAALGGTDY